MSKSSSFDGIFPESCGWVEPQYMSEGEWTCEGKPKSVCAEYIQMVGATVIRPLERSMYDGTWLRAFLKENEYRWHRRKIYLSY